MALVSAAVPEPPAAARAAAVAAAGRLAVSRGVTAVGDMGRYPTADPDSPWRDLVVRGEGGAVGLGGSGAGAWVMWGAEYKGERGGGVCVRVGEFRAGEGRVGVAVGIDGCEARLPDMFACGSHHPCIWNGTRCVHCPA